MSNVSRLCCPDQAEHSREGKAQLETVEEPSIMRTENYPTASMEALVTLTKVFQVR